MKTQGKCVSYKYYKTNKSRMKLKVYLFIFELSNQVWTLNKNSVN